MHRVHADAHYAPKHLPRRRKKRGEIVRDFRARGKLRVIEVVASPEGEVERCTLCAGKIDRFDREAYLLTLRCCACEGALAE